MITEEKTQRREKIFLSWKGDTSKLYAAAFERFLDRLSLGSKTFFSDQDVQRGDEWRSYVISAIRDSRVVIAFLTKENIELARWIECEVAAIYLGAEGNLVFPIFLDMDWKELSSESAWNGPLHGVSFLKPTVEDVQKMMKRIGMECGIDSLKDTAKVAAEINTLLGEWKRLKPAALSEFKTSTPPEFVSVLHCFEDDAEFAAWAYQYHRMAHHARDLMVHIMDRYAMIPDPKAVLEQVLNNTPGKSHPHPEMEKFRDELRGMLDVVEFVFSKLVGSSGARVWACLRDLRGDGKYYNYLRSAHGSTPGRDARAVPWDASCGAIQALLDTTCRHLDEESEHISGRNCTIITDPGKPTWPPYSETFGDSYRDPFRKQSILGAILLKRVTGVHMEPVQSTMWWVLCVNSDTPDVFSLAHRKLLQGCNDAFSVVANALLRASYTSEIPSQQVLPQSGEH